MSKEYVIVPKEDYVDTCDAIREKINSTALLKSDEMAQAVRDISASAKEEQEKTVDITENGTTEILPDEGKALSKVSVNTNVVDSYYDAFWDNFQQNGERTDYYRAFGSYWADDSFAPKYDMIFIIGNEAFRDCGSIDIVQRLKENNVFFDTSNATNLNHCFYNSNVTTVPTVSLAKVGSAFFLFYGCRYLHTIEKFIVHSNFTINNAFGGCVALKNIAIEGEIGTSFDIKYSPLTAESAKSIITHLVNYTGTENEFTYSVLFADSVWELLNAEGATAPGNITWEEYVNSIGWNK